MATRIDEGNAGRPTPAAHPQKRAPHKKPKAFFRDLWREIKHDELGDVAAMLTYYAIFALFPMAVFVLTIALMVVPNDTINQGVGMLTDTMPAQVRDILTGYVQVLQSKAGLLS